MAGLSGVDVAALIGRLDRAAAEPSARSTEIETKLLDTAATVSGAEVVGSQRARGQFRFGLKFSPGSQLLFNKHAC